MTMADPRSHIYCLAARAAALLAALALLAACERLLRPALSLALSLGGAR
ncbi:MAG: hypothetical protein OXN96_19230 [Bryobacterales bacterium]|nr:hypothetical protein [Bryobacterales bacterium]